MDFDLDASDPEAVNTVETPAAPHRTSEQTVNALADLIGEDLPTAVYLHILNAGHATMRDLLALGHPPEALDSVIVILENRNLVRPDSGGGWRAAPPEQALRTLAGQLEARAMHIRAAVPGLVAAYRNAAEREGHSRGIAGVERLTGEREVAFALAQCFASASSEAKAMRTDSMVSRNAAFDALPGSREGHFGPAECHVDVNTVLDAGLVATFTEEDFATFQEVENVHVSIATGVPFTAAVNDHGLAVIETCLEGRIDGLLVRDPGLVTAISASIDLVLSLSTPWRITPAPHVPEELLTDEERAILALLAAGMPDATIARRIGVSPRTLDRRVRSLLDRLHATTRFEAGVNATRRGWI